ncbi:phosphoribosyltransferase family protein [Marinoscillum pacificum]|uniref:phosphoribosyltransferase family protein n=1 Tax=Marinoscillum pacificum TaxID=392723 RepID=UPI0021573A96|nr:phosphoribosyltransferase family protein [Marinoscillum pacificum]|tara:strand:+ start:37 stop:543 length:507 start_codon:yes stop_codon:yes gene_type:complete
MIKEQNLILTGHQVQQIIRRIAFEIYEDNFEEKHLIIVGVHDKGYQIADMLVSQLSDIAPEITTKLVKLHINKENPVASEVTLDVPSKELKGKSIVLVDDVLNSGKTMAYGFKAILDVEVKKLQMAVLVNRSHKRFPVLANYMGYELSTTIDEHVEVVLEEGKGVFLY